MLSRPNADTVVYIYVTIVTGTDIVQSENLSNTTNYACNVFQQIFGRSPFSFYKDLDSYSKVRKSTKSCV